MPGQSEYCGPPRLSEFSGLCLFCLVVVIGCGQPKHAETQLPGPTPSQETAQKTKSTETGKSDKLIMEEELRTAINNLLVDYPRAFSKNTEIKTWPMVVVVGSVVEIGLFRCDLKLRTFSYSDMKGVFFINEQGKWTGKITEAKAS